jgi:hypothetical protein
MNKRYNIYVSYSKLIEYLFNLVVRDLRRIIFHSYDCDRSTLTTSQKYLCTCPLPVDRSSQLLFPSVITEEHHSRMDFAYLRKEIVVNIISCLCNTILIHALLHHAPLSHAQYQNSSKYVVPCFFCATYKTIEIHKNF